jgi:hypothetical protein
MMLFIYMQYIYFSKFITDIAIVNLKIVPNIIINPYFILCFAQRRDKNLRRKLYISFLSLLLELKYRYILYRVFLCSTFYKAGVFSVHKRTAGSTLSSNIHPEQIPGQESPTWKIVQQFNLNTDNLSVFRIRIRMILGLPDPHLDPDPNPTTDPSLFS